MLNQAQRVRSGASTERRSNILPYSSPLEGNGKCASEDPPLAHIDGNRAHASGQGPAHRVQDVARAEPVWRPASMGDAKMPAITEELTAYAEHLEGSQEVGIGASGPPLP